MEGRSLSLRGFSGDAYLNEMGITNPDNPDEVTQCAAHQKAYGLPLQDAVVEDTTESDGRADIDRFSDFMRGLRRPRHCHKTGRRRTERSFSPAWAARAATRRA